MNYCFPPPAQSSQIKTNEYTVALLNTFTFLNGASSSTKEESVPCRHCFCCTVGAVTESRSAPTVCNPRHCTVQCRLCHNQKGCRPDRSQVSVSLSYLILLILTLLYSHTRKEFWQPHAIRELLRFSIARSMFCMELHFQKARVHHSLPRGRETTNLLRVL